jgi:hypothetical protein
MIPRAQDTYLQLNLNLPNVMHIQIGHELNVSEVLCDMADEHGDATAVDELHERQSAGCIGVESRYGPSIVRSVSGAPQHQKSAVPSVRRILCRKKKGASHRI